MKKPLLVSHLSLAQQNDELAQQLPMPKYNKKNKVTGNSITSSNLVEVFTLPLVLVGAPHQDYATSSQLPLVC